MQRRRFLVGVGAVAGAAAVTGLPARARPAVPEVRHTRLAGLDGARRLRSADDASSPPVQAPFRFTLLGLALPEGVEQARVRTSDDGETWTSWVTLGLLGASGEHADTDATDDPRPWRMTGALWVGRARWLQVDGADPRRVGVELIDSDGASAGTDTAVGRVARSLEAEDTAVHAASTPAIITREEWGADASSSEAASRLRDPRAAVVHHTAGATDYAPEDSAGIVRGIHRYHTRSLGWSDIGYNVLVDRYGQVFEGRAGGIAEAVVGAHAAGFNSDTVGVGVLGSFDAHGVPAEGGEAIADVVASIFATHRIDPRAEVLLLSRGSARFGSRAEISSGTVVGHRELGWTACPGDGLDRQLGDLHERASRRAEERAGPARLGQPEGKPDEGPVDRLAHRAAPRMSATAAAWFWQAAETVVLASADDYPDALAGAAVAAELDAPLLLTDPEELSGEVDERLTALGARRVVVLGGPAAVADAVTDTLAERGLRIERIAGADRFETAARIAREVAEPGGDVAICLGRHEEDRRAWPDAVSAGALAATSPRVPILLTEQDHLPDATREAIAELAPTRALLIGGEAAIEPAVAREIARLGLEGQRLAGADRYATSLAVARETRARLPAERAPILFASGEEFTHAVIAGGICARRQAPLLLVPRADVGQDAAAHLREARAAYERGLILGDVGSVSDRVRWRLNRALAP